MEEERRDSCGRPEGIGSNVWMKLALDRINDNSSTAPEAKAGYMETDGYGLVDLMTGIWDNILLPQWREEVTSWEVGGNVVIYGEQRGVQKSSWRSSKWIEKENSGRMSGQQALRSLEICGQICKAKTLSMAVDFASATPAAWEMERLLYPGLGFGLENTREWVKDKSCVCKRMTIMMNLRT